MKIYKFIITTSIFGMLSIIKLQKYKYMNYV